MDPLLLRPPDILWHGHPALGTHGQPEELCATRSSQAEKIGLGITCFLSKTVAQGIEATSHAHVFICDSSLTHLSMLPAYSMPLAGVMPINPSETLMKTSTTHVPEHLCYC